MHVLEVALLYILYRKLKMTSKTCPLTFHIWIFCKTFVQKSMEIHACVSTSLTKGLSHLEQLDVDECTSLKVIYELQGMRPWFSCSAGQSNRFGAESSTKAHLHIYQCSKSNTNDRSQNADILKECHTLTCLFPHSMVACEIEGNESIILLENGVVLEGKKKEKKMMRK